MNRTLTTYGLIFCCLLLASCGFQLRGSFTLPPELQTIYIKSQLNNAALENELISAFTGHGIHIPRQSAEAPITLVIENERLTKTINSVSSTANVRQYLLRYTVSYRLTNNQCETIFGPSTSIASRSLTINSNQMLGSINEESLLEQEMRREVAQNILNVLSSKQVIQQFGG